MSSESELAELEAQKGSELGLVWQRAVRGAGVMGRARGRRSRADVAGVEAGALLLQGKVDLLSGL